LNKHWQQILQKLWGIEVKLVRLDGEYDLNFLAIGKNEYVLKVMRIGCDPGFIDMQCRAFDHIRANAPDVPVPAIIETISDELFTSVPDENGAQRIIWLMQKMPGKTYANWRPHGADLLSDVGKNVGAMDKALSDFEHPSLQRTFKWDLKKSLWISGEMSAILDPERRALLCAIVQEFVNSKESLDALPSVAIHNDVNDYNILVDGKLGSPARVSGLIDLGDMCANPRVCDLAITGAYMVLDHPTPEAALCALVAGYHSVYPLSTKEIDLLWPLLRMRLAVSVVNSTLMASENPDDPYVVISQRPAWDFLQGNRVNGELIGARLRAACYLPVIDHSDEITSWINGERGNFAPVLGFDLSDAPMRSLSVEMSTTPINPFDITANEAATIGEQGVPDDSAWLGYYGEPRLIYTDKAFRNGDWKASDRRTVHLGIDGFAPAGTTVHTPLDATVLHIDIRKGHLDYGGMVVLRHETPDRLTFFTMYGHLDPESISGLEVGQNLPKGYAVARLGDPTVNGGWNPHIHFQLALSTLGMGHDWPGVANPDEMFFWRKYCPNPAALMNLADEKTAFQPVDKNEVHQGRLDKFGKNLSLTYSAPVMFLRGWKHHLFDEWGRVYLDCYNNVPHVGHAHPRIQAVAADQLKRMNSNTRYLHPAQVAFADKILEKLPDLLSVCYFVNSGTEANELALRLARAHTGGKDMITPNHGYHGNTTGAISISAYKFNAKGGIGQPDWVQVVDVADDCRGRFQRDDPERAQKYAALVGVAINEIEARGATLAGFIAETFPSVAGQIIPPQGYLADVYQRIRAAGGVCIADEVQTGLGRLGDYYFGFEQQDVVPDIVVMGKPIGNGHPLGVLVTTREIADSFAEGPEYFSTFGGSTLSCRMGKEVLDIVDDENLMENARVMGNALMDGLRKLQGKYDIVGDVRGYGLFIGLELIESKSTKVAGTRLADYVKNRMRENRVLLGSEGPFDNILKIRPPLTIDQDGVEMILSVLDKVLREAV
jgi:4-aminobutyrate aminotransferase-like enzyme/Ser/Thr protein kinase RdoA (MazF antagonist)